MRQNSFVLVYLELYMLWIKRAHQSANFQTCDCSPENKPNSLCQKHYILWSKGAHKVQIVRLSSVGSKFAKFFMPFFRTLVRSWSNFASFFSVMTHNSSVLFCLKHEILWTKVAHRNENFKTCHCSH